MKNFKSEKGSITILVLVSLIFLTTFLISSYVIISNKMKTQKKVISDTKDMYEQSIEEIYNSYFNSENIIPIYTVEQLLMIGEEHQNVNINGKYYNFTNDANMVYMLMSDLKFKVSDYPDKVDDTGYWVPLGDRVNVIGKNHTIEVVYEEEIETTIEVDETTEEQEVVKNEYSVIYSQESNYSEPYYEIDIFPILSSGNTAENAKILLNDEETGLTGKTKVKIRRLEKTKISIYLNENYNEPQTEIYIENPEKISNIKFTLEELNVTIKINTNIQNAIITINGTVQNSITAEKGTKVNYKVTCDGYYTREGTLDFDSSKEINIELSPVEWKQFSEKFYFTRCSNSDYEGILNGGSATLSKYDLGGDDYSMGDFYIDETDIVKKISEKGNISKLTLYFQYYQTRKNTTLYTNTIKSALFIGNIQKMNQKETERSNKTKKQAQYEIINISRNDLKEGITVKLVNYIEGTLKINSTVENMYVIIEGEQPDEQ